MKIKSNFFTAKLNLPEIIKYFDQISNIVQIFYKACNPLKVCNEQDLLMAALEFEKILLPVIVKSFEYMELSSHVLKEFFIENLQRFIGQIYNCNESPTFKYISGICQPGASFHEIRKGLDCSIPVESRSDVEDFEYSRYFAAFAVVKLISDVSMKF